MSLLRGLLPKLPTGRSARFTTSLPPLHCMKAIGFLQISQPTAPPSPRQSLVKRRGLSLKLFMGLSEDRVPQNFVVNPHFPHENSDSRHPPSIFRQSLTESKQVSEEHLPLWDWMQKPFCQCQMEHNRIDCEDDWTWTRMAWRNGGFLASGTWQLSKQMLQMLQWQRQPPSRHCQMSRSPDRVLEGVNGWLSTIGSEPIEWRWQSSNRLLT